MATKFCFFHPYHPETWQAMIDCGLIKEGDGVRFSQNARLRGTPFEFNVLAKQGSELYCYLEKTRAPFYIDRYQGGAPFPGYPYDETLVQAYEQMLGENFKGWQMHEWLSNYRTDLRNLDGVSDANWNELEIERVIREKYPYPYLHVEAMSLAEIASYGKPKTLADFRRNMFDVYRDRVRKTGGRLIPCDSIFLAFEFEFKNGAKTVMPEVGAQSADARMQLAYARGEAKAYGREFGVYYEPWSNFPTTACCYQRDQRNEWGVVSSQSHYKATGENGGSSRSLQWRVYLYGYLSNAAMMAEEWGLCNTFYDWKDFELSPYGRVKLDFLNFTRKYTDVGEKLALAAVILPETMDVLDDIREPRLYLSRKLPDEYSVMEMERIKDSIKRIFATPIEFLGRECKTFLNTTMPDAVDMLNAGAEKEKAILGYKYLVDLTCDGEFAKTHKNCVRVEELEALLREELPCTVEGLHWFVNERDGGGYYLTVFNNIGIQRNAEEGEYPMPEGERSAKVCFKNGALPTMLEGDGNLEKEGGDYRLTLPAGGFAFIRF